MRKYAWLSVGLSLLMVALLGVYGQFISLYGQKDLMNMAFGLPIGLILAVNINIVIAKLRLPK